MIRKYALPLLAGLGAITGLFIVYWSQKVIPPPPISFPPPQSPYEYSIAGAGIIEASSQNIAIGSPINEIVTNVYVVEGDKVKAEAPLFKLDTRAYEAQAETARANLSVAMISMQNTKTQFDFYQRLIDKRAVSENAYEQAFFAYKEAEAQVKVAAANLNEIEVNIQRSTINAPIDGEVLQVNIYPGEIAAIVPYSSSQPSAYSQSAFILLGAVQPLQVRIDIDEDDAWRYEAGARATAFVRGNSTINFPLNFVRVEPYVVPKNSFTGETTEKIDTRVLQVLYRFEKKELPVYTGQVMDIFIETKAIEIPMRQ